jgi:hypothetical protein
MSIIGGCLHRWQTYLRYRIKLSSHGLPALARLTLVAALTPALWLTSPAGEDEQVNEGIVPSTVYIDVIEIK